MYNKERIKAIVSEWFQFKTAIILSDKKLDNLVEDIMKNKQCDNNLVGRSLYLVQHKKSMVNHGLFDSYKKANNYIKGNNFHFSIRKYKIS